tara:strand:- start:19 stop:255 length:237 start_codon:yes stop_codon:yes gene_type:complete
MFPLIAIAAFFILGIAFFVIGKDDFGLKGVKGVSNNTSKTEKEVVKPEKIANNESNEEKELVSSDSLSEGEDNSNFSD